MAKELYLYSPIFSFTAQELISEIEINKSEDIIMRLNSPGGSVFAGWGIIAKMKEHGSVKVKVDGVTSSMSTFVLIFADEAEALDVSKIHLHRADMLVEDGSDQKFLDEVNKELREKLESKVDSKKFEEVTGYTIDQLFDADQRINVNLSAKEAMEIGLIQKIVTLTPSEIEAYGNKYFSIAAKKEEIKPEKIKPTKQIKMDIEKLKSEQPELYNQIHELGIASERDRVCAWITFADVDQKLVVKGIKEGSDLSATDMAEFSLKSFNAESLKKIEDTGKVKTDTKEPEGESKTDKEKEIEAFEKEVNVNLGRNKSQE